MKSLPVPPKSLDCFALANTVYVDSGVHGDTAENSTLSDSPGLRAFVSLGPGLRSWITLPTKVGGSQVLPGGGVIPPRTIDANPAGTATFAEPRL